jgi:hypothetical protein
MEGMKKKLTSEKTANDPNSRINGSGVLQRLSELVEAAGVNGEALYWPTDSKSKSESRKVVQLGEGVVDLESPELVERFVTGRRGGATLPHPHSSLLHRGVVQW